MGGVVNRVMTEEQEKRELEILILGAMALRGVS